MNKHRYKVGDTVNLKSGVFRSGETAPSCRIASVLPDAYGLAQYRVQFQGENWERRITQDDISNDTPSATTDKAAAPPLAPGGSWVKLDTIKIKK